MGIPFDFLNTANLRAIDEMYARFLANPDEIEPQWKQFFQGFSFALANYSEKNENDLFAREYKVLQLIHAYRTRGHLFTRTNPVRERRQYFPTLDIENFGLTAADLSNQYSAGEALGIGKTSLKNIIEHLSETYCESIGVEYMYIRNTEITEWLRQYMESRKNRPNFSREKKEEIFYRLTEAVLFEQFIQRKFPGQKSFSLEGAESLIPALDEAVNLASAMGVSDFVLGMAHRGRLNVLANIMKKDTAEIFSEFSSTNMNDISMLGDVKYHLGQATNVQTQSLQNINLSLCPNPSHLEAVYPVVLGIARAKSDLFHQSDRKKVLPVIIHGDAAIAAQGVVYESLQLAMLPGYTTGGSLHIVINNQIGFTTSYTEARSSVYCTDVAKILQCPILHVNGDDAEAMTYAVNLALEFRQKFQRDVFIDILCYRKHGHNESDEPRFTQPLLYKIIEKHPNPAAIYAKKLMDEKMITEPQISDYQKNFSGLLETAYQKSNDISRGNIKAVYNKMNTEDLLDAGCNDDYCISEERVKEIGKKIFELPDDYPFFRKIVGLYKSRQAMLQEGVAIDWGVAETLAYASLLDEGISVRISGQDVQRGTFSHRHACLNIEGSHDKYIPLKNAEREQAKFEIYNSPLSEYAVLGFEYGYSMITPNCLTIWEAQFGDFFNGAQIIFDQFLSSAKNKWNLSNDLVILLPHGYEGQGPEHSSARIERILASCADNNIRVANCSLPANFFHLLRSQLKEKERKPLVVFTPKSLLRNPYCVSPLHAFSKGTFMPVIDDNDVEKQNVMQVVLCSGKIYYEIWEEKRKRNLQNSALIRIEQLYPFPYNEMQAVIQSYPNAKRIVFVQEEPVNMGTWFHVRQSMPYANLQVVARPPSSVTATGFQALHKLRQQKILEKTFGECDCERNKDECKMICLDKEWWKLD